MDNDKINQLEAEAEKCIQNSKDAFTDYLGKIKSPFESQKEAAPTMAVRSLYWQNEAIITQNKLIIDYLKEQTGDKQ